MHELDTAMSRYDSNFAFHEPQSYDLPDTVAFFKNGQPQASHAVIGALLLTEVNRKLDSLGWVKHPLVQDDLPDLMVSITVHENHSVGMIWGSTPGYWWGWYPGWDFWYPSGGWYYPWITIPYQIHTGSVIVEMAAPNQAQRNRIPIVYSGVLDGLLQGSERYRLQRLQVGINDLFGQAPFRGATNRWD